MSANNQPLKDETLLDREIAAAMRAGITQPSADFTGELMSVIAEEEVAPAIAPARNPIMRFSWVLVGLGVAFLLISLLIPRDATASLTMSGSAMWTAAALALISLLALTQSRPRYL